MLIVIALDGLITELRT